MPPEKPQRRSNVRRANVTACMRCRARKQRCDQTIPACSNCASAGVECVSVDIHGQSTPRSYIKSLEDRVAYLEKQLIAHGVTDYDAVAGDDKDADSSPSAAAAAAAAAAGVPTFLMGTLDRLATANTLPVLDPDGAYQSLLDSLPYDHRTALPAREAARVLVDAYFEHSDFFSPILVQDDADAVLDHVYGSSSSSSSRRAPELARFRIALIFAVAGRLLNCKDACFPTSRAEAYYASATGLLAAHPGLVQTAGLDQLENLLLLIQYLFFSSNLGSAWYLLGFATRMALELALHREPVAAKSAAAMEVEEDHGEDNDHPIHNHNSSNDGGGAADDQARRRWVFWAVYSFERILCHVLNRPCSIPDDVITTPLPDDAHEDTATARPGRRVRRRHAAVHLIRHRQLCSEMEKTLTAERAALDDYPAWRDAMWQRLQQWRAAAPAPPRLPAPPSSQLAPADIFDGCYHNTMVRLYLPSPHLPVTSDREYAFLARSAARAVEAYKASFKEGTLRFYWRTLHNLFRAGAALVQCLKVASSATGLPFGGGAGGGGGYVTPADIRRAIHTCSSVLWGMVERYQLGRAYRDMFETIAAPVLQATHLATEAEADHRLASPMQPTPPDLLFMSMYVPPDEGFYSVG